MLGEVFLFRGEIGVVEWQTLADKALIYTRLELQKAAQTAFKAV